MLKPARAASFFLAFCALLAYSRELLAYGQPQVNLGLTNILDGGPIRPLPGWYFIDYTNYYHTHSFLDANGQPLDGVPSPTLDILATVPQLAYLSSQNIVPHGKWGISFILPLTVFSGVDRNSIGMSTSGSGVGDFLIGPYIQWDLIRRQDRPFFQHRVEFTVSFPTGKNRQPSKAINPGNGFFYINPYWAATFYFTPHWALSWRLHYLWSSLNKKTVVQAGDAIHANYSMEYEVIPNLWVALVGYFFQQLHNNKQKGQEIPDTRERVFGLGPGALYEASSELYLAAYLYQEFNVVNRPQGISAVIKLIKHF